MGSIMGVESGGGHKSGSDGAWSEALPGGVIVYVDLADCPMGISQLESAMPIPANSPLIFDVVDGLMSNHARHHSEAGVPRGNCHRHGYHTQEAD